MTFTPAQTATYSLAALVILLLPGAALLVWLPGRHGFLSRLADSVGLSVSLTAITALIGFLVGLRFTRPLVTGLYVFCALVLLAGFIWRAIRSGTRPSFNWKGALVGVLGLAALAGLAGWRLYQARELLLPAWVDSVHHTLIVRVIMENGGLPATLDPYLPAEFSYHYGFHVLAALFASLARVEPAVALLWFGQILNALIALSVYRLAMEVWNDWRRAVLAALLVGFGLHMPAYYLTWGRYTLLTGLLLLPLAMAALLRVSRPPTDRASVLAAVLLTTGVALSHYTTLLLLGFFTLILLLGCLLKPRARDESESLSQRWQAAWPIALAALGGVLIAAPWLARVWQQSSTQAALSLVSPLNSNQSGYWDYILYLLGPAHNATWLAVAGVGLVWALLRKPAHPLAVWGLLLALLTLPWGLRLAPFRPDHMAIALFLPASLLAADLVFSLVELAGRLPWIWLKRVTQAAVILTALAGIGWGGWQTRDILNPSTVFITQADLDALNWVRENTPPEARFMINTTGWMENIYRGMDGGYWLLSYTGRQAILPPVMYTYAASQFVAQTEEWANQSSKLTTCDAVFWKLVDEFDASYLYLRLGQGSLQPDALVNCPQLVNVYRRGGVSIYEIAR
ncbi:MAG: hypothetical protein ACYDHA_04750 [Bellilinea sp.]